MDGKENGIRRDDISISPVAITNDSCYLDSSLITDDESFFNKSPTVQQYSSKCKYFSCLFCGMGEDFRVWQCGHLYCIQCHHDIIAECRSSRIFTGLEFDGPRCKTCGDIFKFSILIKN